jgi:hypothetical protein
MVVFVILNEFSFFCHSERVALPFFVILNELLGEEESLQLVRG